VFARRTPLVVKRSSAAAVARLKLPDSLNAGSLTCRGLLTKTGVDCCSACRRSALYSPAICHHEHGLVPDSTLCDLGSKAHIACGLCWLDRQPSTL